jgi:hypothetical protein
MEKSAKIFFLFQTSLSAWLLTLALLTLIFTWILFDEHNTLHRKGPGINLKEF